MGKYNQFMADVLHITLFGVIRKSPMNRTHSLVTFRLASCIMLASHQHELRE